MTDEAVVYLLEMSTKDVHQYRITVLAADNSTLLTHMMNMEVDDPFKRVGIYTTLDELMQVVVSYLAMESSK